MINDTEYIACSFCTGFNLYSPFSIQYATRSIPGYSSKYLPAALPARPDNLAHDSARGVSRAPELTVRLDSAAPRRVPFTSSGLSFLIREVERLSLPVLLRRMK